MAKVNAWIQGHLLLLKILLFAGLITPAVGMVLAAFGKGWVDLGADPVEKLLHECGEIGLQLLLITLAVTPARKLLKLPALVRFRRMLGLFSFTYLILHFTVYAWLDQKLSLARILEDIVERPYITIGFAALVMLVPLAVTSTNAMMRRLKRKWATLHKLIYPISILGVWHFWWQVKQDIREPLIYAGILALLLGFRVVDWQIRKRRAAARRPPAAS